MNIRLVLLIAVVGFMAMLTSSAMAVGIGAYVDAGGGKHTHDISTSDYTKPGNASFTNIMGGFILDTCTGKDKIFNYRLKVGGGSNVKYEREMDMNISKVEMTHTFGFAVVRTKKIRFWLGPSVGGNFQWGKSESSRKYMGSLKVTERFNWWYDPFPVQGDLLMIGAMVGPVYYPLYVFGLYQDKIKKIYFGGGSFGLTTGLNINIVKQFGIGLEFGFKYDVTSGKEDRRVYHFLYNNPYSKFNSKAFIHGWNLFGSIAFMYRIGEK